MTPEERVIELMEQANPVPDPNDTPLTEGSGAYLRRLEQRSNIMTLSTVDHDTTGHHSPHTPKKPVLMVTVAAATVALIVGLVVIATRSDDDPIPADQPASPIPTANPAVDAEPAPVTPDSVPTESTPTVATDEPGELNTGTVLDGGTTYRTSTDPERGMTPEMTLTIPAEQGGAAWSVLNAFPLEVDFLPLGDWLTPGVREPTFGLAPAPQGVPVDEVVASVEAYAADDPAFELSVDSDRVRNETVTVLRGTSSVGTGDNHRVPTSDNSYFLVPPGREFVVYLIEGPAHVVAAKIESSRDDLDAAVERIVPILNTVEFR